MVLVQWNPFARYQSSWPGRGWLEACVSLLFVSVKLSILNKRVICEASCEPMFVYCIHHSPFWHMVSPMCMYIQPSSMLLFLCRQHGSMHLLNLWERQEEYQSFLTFAVCWFVAASAQALPAETESVPFVWASHLQTDIAVGSKMAVNRLLIRGPCGIQFPKCMNPPVAYLLSVKNKDHVFTSAKLLNSS